jgi:hypothetical protein
MVFDPVSLGILAVAEAASAGMKAYAQNKASKRSAKEAKKQTRSDVLLDLLKQHLESQKATRKSANERHVRHAASVQNKANEFRQSLLGR